MYNAGLFVTEASVTNCRFNTSRPGASAATPATTPAAAPSWPRSNSRPAVTAGTTARTTSSAALSKPRAPPETTGRTLPSADAAPPSRATATATVEPEARMNTTTTLTTQPCIERHNHGRRAARSPRTPERKPGCRCVTQLTSYGSVSRIPWRTAEQDACARRPRRPYSNTGLDPRCAVSLISSGPITVRSRNGQVLPRIASDCPEQSLTGFPGPVSVAWLPRPTEGPAVRLDTLPRPCRPLPRQSTTPAVSPGHGDAAHPASPPRLRRSAAASWSLR